MPFQLQLTAGSPQARSRMAPTLALRRDRARTRCSSDSPKLAAPRSGTKSQSVDHTKTRRSKGSPDALLGLLLSRAHRQPAPGHCFQRPPPMGFAPTNLPPGCKHPNGSSAGRPCGVSRHPAADCPALTGQSTLMRFATSSPSRRYRFPSGPGSWFRLRCRAASPRTAHPLRASQASYRSPSSRKFRLGSR